MTAESNRRTTIALYGGAFDPPHIGHVAFCRELASRTEFDSVWVLPSYRHPFGKAMTDFEHRLQMCRIAFSSISEKIEIRKDEAKVRGKGYTIELIHYLLKEYPDTCFVLVLGTDNYSQKHKWKDFEQIDELVRVEFFGRKGWEQENEKLGLKALFPEVSSYQLRSALAAGAIPEKQLPPGIADYIRTHRLYRA